MTSERDRQSLIIKLLYTAFFISVIALIVSIGALFYVQFADFTEKKNAASASGTAASESVTQYAGRQSSAGVSNESTAFTATNPSVTAGSATDQSDTSDAASSLNTSIDSTSTYIPEDLRGARDAIGLNDSKIADIRATQASSFYYNHLSDTEQRLYAEIYYILTNLGADVYVSTNTSETLDKVQNCV